MQYTKYAKAVFAESLEEEKLKNYSKTINVVGHIMVAENILTVMVS